MANNRNIMKGDLTRRALIFAAPSLLVPGAALAALAPTPGASEGPFYPVRIPNDDDADLIRVEGAVREAGGDILRLAGRVLDANARPIAGAPDRGLAVRCQRRLSASRRPPACVARLGLPGFRSRQGRRCRALRLPDHRACSLSRAHAAYPRQGAERQARTTHHTALSRGPSPEPVRLPVPPPRAGRTAPRLDGHQTARRIPPPRLRNRNRLGDRGVAEHRTRLSSWRGRTTALTTRRSASASASWSRRSRGAIAESRGVPFEVHFG